MPTNIFISNTTDLTLDLSIKTSSKRSMSSIKATTVDNASPSLTTSDPGGGNISIIDNDEVKIFECEKHEEDVDIDDDDTDNGRLSPVIKEEELSPQQISSTNLNDRLNSEQQLHSFFPYFISPYYHPSNGAQSLDKLASLESLSKFMSPPPAHISNSNLCLDQNTGMHNSIYPLSSPASFQSPYSQHWRPHMFPFVFPPNYPLSQSSSSHSASPTQKRSSNIRRIIEDSSQQQQQQPKQSLFHEDHKQKRSHIKKPLNAFMLFMKEQRAQVVQECTLRESAAINQILGRKWHELDRNVQQKYYDMARDERMRHMQLYPGWSARDNYGARKKRGNKGKKREKNQGENGECLNQKKCRARFGLDQQANWCKHCKRKKKCLRYTENETTSIGVSSWSEEDDTDNIDDSNDCDVIPIMEHNNNNNNNNNNNLSIHTGISKDSDEENKSRLLKYQQMSNSLEHNPTNKMSMAMSMMASRKDSSSSSSSSQVSFLQPSHQYPYYDSFLSTTSMPILNEFKRET
ncbi:unnamed protein product [Rotaria magnacalcarata]|uniref:HMG box domain-containing protein n=3 Tax=Rotaria magnacalcarata TaxID=392030 RepID=A0A815XRF6_9BILA|nr:unnamed protein product [Rotaria magnacalcarata]